MASGLPWRSIGSKPRPYRSPGCLVHRLIHTALPARQELSISPAAPIDLSDLPPPDLSKARIVPASASYFTGRPQSTDRLLSLQALALRYETLPTVAPGQAPRVAWRTLAQYRLLVGEPLQASKYRKVINILQRLNRVHPAVMPQDVVKALDIYKREIDPFGTVKKPAVIDEDGKTFQIGRRKSSSAKVYLIQGDGQVLINGKSLNTAFARPHDRDSALWALRATERLDKYNIWALTNGGGTTGQAESVALGVAKALMVFEPSLKPVLRRAGCISRDRRRVERKKPGHVKARKMPAWVKR